MYLIKQVYKFHCLFFYKLVKAILRLDKIFSDFGTMSMEWVFWRALIAMLFIQGIWLYILLLIVEIVNKKTIPNLFNDQLMSAILLTGVIFTFNYFTLIYKKRWFKYDEEFAGYSKTKNKVINIAIPVFYTLSFALYFVIGELLAKLGHAGKIEGFFDI